MINCQYYINVFIYSFRRKVMEKPIFSNQYTFNVSSCIYGVYFITTRTDNSLQTLKFIKKSAN